MRIPLLLFFLFCHGSLRTTLAQPPRTIGYTCTPNRTSYPCQAYAFYRASAPDLLDLAAVGDLFSVSRRMIAKPSSISSLASPLVPNQSLFIPLTCSCNTINSSLSLSFAGLTYTIQNGDTFYYLSTIQYQNLTTYQSVELVNPSLVPTLLHAGNNPVFPVFCRCPNETQLQDRVNYLISYVFQPSDTLPGIASRFGSTVRSIVDINGDRVRAYDTIFVPVTALPNLTQPAIPPTSSGGGRRKRDVVGLGIGLGLCGVLLIWVCGLWGYREASWRKRRDRRGRDEETRGWKARKKEAEANLMVDISGCLDKYRVYSVEELIEATDGFDRRLLVHGSVYKGSIDGELCAIKKMKWNAYEELKILQKVNHGNLLKLEGFCIDPEEANCYLIYEYAENGSLHSWLHGGRANKKLNWKTRLRIAVDIANGLQYIHEHTRPRVVHKDMKSSNILLDSNMRAKIANFGLSKSGHNAVTAHIVGTQGYMAPEYLSDGVVTTKTDVFSFGVVLLELVSGREAVDETGKFLWVKVESVFEGDREGKDRMSWFLDPVLSEESSCSAESVTNVLAVAVACLKRDPVRRPSMVDIVYALCKCNDLFSDISDDGLSPGQVLAR